MKKTREEKQIDGFVNEGFEFKGVQYKPLTARILILLEKAKSPFYYGGDQLRGLLDYLYISSHDSKDVITAINSGEFEEFILNFSDKFSPKDLNDLGILVNSQNEDASAAIVEVRGEEAKKG